MNSSSDIRLALYHAIAQGGEVPTVAEIAVTLGLDEADVAAAYHALAEAHVIVLRPGSSEVAWVPPFSAVPTPFRVTAGAVSWYAPCAWDAFGIPAALHRDAVIDARCAWSGAAIPCGVANREAYGDGVIHLLVPAAHFWDDIAYT
jgi:DNA-binding transcriptional MocR family regulator